MPQRAASSVKSMRISCRNEPLSGENRRVRHSVPFWFPFGTGDCHSRCQTGPFSSFYGAEVMQTATAPGPRRLVISELPEIAPGDPTGPRFLVEDIYPSVDGGRYPIKRIVGEPIEVWADLLPEGHDQLAAELLWRKESDADWRRAPIPLVGTERWD